MCNGLPKPVPEMAEILPFVPTLRSICKIFSSSFKSLTQIKIIMLCVSKCKACDEILLGKIAKFGRNRLGEVMKIV